MYWEAWGEIWNSPGYLWLPWPRYWRHTEASLRHRGRPAKSSSTEGCFWGGVQWTSSHLSDREDSDQALLHSPPLSHLWPQDGWDSMYISLYKVKSHTSASYFVCLLDCCLSSTNYSPSQRQLLQSWKKLVQTIWTSYPCTIPGKLLPCLYCFLRWN